MYCRQHASSRRRQHSAATAHCFAAACTGCLLLACAQAQACSRYPASSAPPFHRRAGWHGCHGDIPGSLHALAAPHNFRPAALAEAAKQRGPDAATLYGTGGEQCHPRFL